jgi:hypothetical protein
VITEHKVGKITHVAKVRYRELMLLDEEFDREHPFFQRLKEKSINQLGRVAEGLGNYAIAANIYDCIPPGNDSGKGKFLHYYVGDWTLEELLENVDRHHHYLGRAFQNNGMDSAPIYEDLVDKKFVEEDWIEAAIAAQWSHEFDLALKAANKFMEVEWPAAKSIAMSNVGAGFYLEELRAMDEGTRSWGYRAPHRIADIFIGLARRAKHDGFAEWKKFYDHAEHLHADCKYWASIGRINMEMKDFGRAFDNLKKGKNWFRAAMLHKKVSAHPRTISSVQRNAVTRQYLNRLHGEYTYKPGMKMSPEEMANRVRQQKHYLGLLMEDYRWAEAERYAEQQGFAKEAAYAGELLLAADRMRNIIVPRFIQVNRWIEQYVPLDSLAWLLRLKNEFCEVMLDGIIEEWEKRFDRKHVEAILEALPIAQRVAKKHLLPELDLKDEDVYAIIATAMYRNIGRGMHGIPDLREDHDKYTILHKIAEKRPRYANALASKLCIGDAAREEWCKRLQRKYERLGVSNCASWSNYNYYSCWGGYSLEEVNEKMDSRARVTDGVAFIYGINFGVEE